MLWPGAGSFGQLFCLKHLGPSVHPSGHWSVHSFAQVAIILPGPSLKHLQHRPRSLCLCCHGSDLGAHQSTFLFSPRLLFLYRSLMQRLLMRCPRVNLYTLPQKLGSSPVSPCNEDIQVLASLMSPIVYTVYSRHLLNVFCFVLYLVMMTS